MTPWIGPALQGPVNVASGGATLVASVPNAEQSTFIRIRGFASIVPQAVTADLDITGAIGVGVVTEEAFAAGVASIPEPFADGDWGGWMVHRMFAYHFEFNDATGINYPSWDFEIDSKAMRKVSPSSRLVVIAESQAGAFNIDVPLRFLVKLS